MVWLGELDLSTSDNNGRRQQIVFVVGEAPRLAQSRGAISVSDPMWGAMAVDEELQALEALTPELDSVLDSVAAVIPGAVSSANVASNVAGFRHAIPADFWAELKAARLIRSDAPVPSTELPRS